MNGGTTCSPRAPPASCARKKRDGQPPPRPPRASPERPTKERVTTRQRESTRKIRLVHFLIWPQARGIYIEGRCAVRRIAAKSAPTGMGSRTRRRRGTRGRKTGTGTCCRSRFSPSADRWKCPLRGLRSPLWWGRHSCLSIRPVERRFRTCVGCLCRHRFPTGIERPAQISFFAGTCRTSDMRAGYDEARHMAEKNPAVPLPISAPCWRNLLEDPADRASICAGPSTGSGWGVLIRGCSRSDLRPAQISAG
jgi:hypothetical protein